MVGSALPAHEEIEANAAIEGHDSIGCSAQASLPELIPLKILFGNPEKTSPNVRKHVP